MHSVFLGLSYTLPSPILPFETNQHTEHIPPWKTTKPILSSNKTIATVEISAHYISVSEDYRLVIIDPEKPFAIFPHKDVNYSTRSMRWKVKGFFEYFAQLCTKPN